MGAAVPPHRHGRSRTAAQRRARSGAVPGPQHHSGGTVDDNRLGAVQARLARYAVERAGLDLTRLWWHYFQLGGEAGMLEVDAYLHGCLRLPAAHRDLLARAVNGLVRDAPVARVPFSWEIDAGSRDDAGPQDRGSAPGLWPRA